MLCLLDYRKPQLLSVSNDGTAFFSIQKVDKILTYLVILALKFVTLFTVL